MIGYSRGGGIEFSKCLEALTFYIHTVLHSELDLGTSSILKTGQKLCLHSEADRDRQRQQLITNNIANLFPVNR